MNTERLLREVEKRLDHLPAAEREEVLDALREEFARERRRVDPTLTVELERERRMEAETLREVLEAITRQARLEETISEVLKQLAKLVTFDSCSLALLEPDGRLRIIAARGFANLSEIVGVIFRDDLSDEIRQERQAISIADVQEDPRYSKIRGTESIRSWVGLPLLVEGEILGLLSLDRYRVEPFEAEEVHRAKAVAFSAAAAIRKARLLEQVRRYASLMERVVAVDQAVFAGQEPIEVAGAILEGALRVGNYPGGLLILEGPDGPRVVAARGEAFTEMEGLIAPADLSSRVQKRLGPDLVPGIGLSTGLPLPAAELYLVPLATPDHHLGTLVLLDVDGETPDDRLLESYASRAAMAYLHTVRART